MDKSHNLITSVAFFFIVLLVGTMSREVKAQDTNSPSMNSPNAAQNKSVTPSGVVLLDKKVGFPIVINQPGSFSLKSNLTVPANTNGIVIAADNVTLDLNGFSITGNGSGVGITDNAVAHTAIAIRNGTITNFTSGILLFSTQVSIKQIQASSNRVDGIVVGKNSTVSGNTASQNTEGIIADINSTVSGNTTSQNDSGIIVRQNSTVSGNTASQNVVGIDVGKNSTVSGNTASQNTDGIIVGQNSTVSGNTASENRGGITVNCPSNIVGNSAVGNTSTTTNIIESGSGCTRANNLPAP